MCVYRTLKNAPHKTQTPSLDSGAGEGWTSGPRAIRCRAKRPFQIYCEHRLPLENDNLILAIGKENFWGGAQKVDGLPGKPYPNVLLRYSFLHVRNINFRISRRYLVKFFISGHIPYHIPSLTQVFVSNYVTSIRFSV